MARGSGRGLCGGRRLRCGLSRLNFGVAADGDEEEDDCGGGKEGGDDEAGGVAEAALFDGDVEGAGEKEEEGERGEDGEVGGGGDQEAEDAGGGTGEGAGEDAEEDFPPAVSAGGRCGGWGAVVEGVHEGILTRHEGRGSLRQAVGFDGGIVGDGGEVAFEVFAAAGGGFGAEVVEGAESGHFFGGGAGEELIDGIAFLACQDFDAAEEGFGKLDSQ
jgi:hypothetical protein